MLNIVKNTTFVGLFDLLAPHSCRGCGLMGNIICDRCKNDIIIHQINVCPKCKSKTKNHKCSKCKDLPPTYVVGNRSTLIGELVHDYKYQSIRALAKPLAEILDAILPQIKGRVAIVPLPTSSRHIRERGFDHTRLITKHFVKLRNNNYQLSSILLRTHNTTQVGTNRSTRLIQADQAYSVKLNHKINPDTTYILFDDVWTTGASMQTAIKKLQQAGAKKLIVVILALSRLN